MLTFYIIHKTANDVNVRLLTVKRFFQNFLNFKFVIDRKYAEIS